MSMHALCNYYESIASTFSTTCLSFYSRLALELFLALHELFLKTFVNFIFLYLIFLETNAYDHHLPSPHKKSLTQNDLLIP